MENENLIKVETPSVRCISRPHFDAHSFIDFLNDEELDWRRSNSAKDAEEIVEVAGRVCYMSFGENQSKISNNEFIKNLISKGHESVLEHVNWTFFMTGVSRTFTHQLVRHRVGFAFSQLSQQYYEESAPKLVVPPYLKNNPDQLALWKQTTAQCFEVYHKLIKDIKKQYKNNSLSKKELLRDIRSTARSVLPNATETKILVTANARAIRNFLKLRGAVEGDWEMRTVSALIFEIVKQDAPVMFQDFYVENMDDGSPKVVFMNEDYGTGAKNHTVAIKERAKCKRL